MGGVLGLQAPLEDYKDIPFFDTALGTAEEDRRRLAAIPLPVTPMESTSTSPELETMAGNPSTLPLAAVTLGVAGALLCLGCALKRKLIALKRRFRSEPVPLERVEISNSAQ